MAALENWCGELICSPMRNALKTPGVTYERILCWKSPQVESGWRVGKSSPKSWPQFRYELIQFSQIPQTPPKIGDLRVCSKYFLGSVWGIVCITELSANSQAVFWFLTVYESNEATGTMSDWAFLGKWWTKGKSVWNPTKSGFQQCFSMFLLQHPLCFSYNIIIHYP